MAVNLRWVDLSSTSRWIITINKVYMVLICGGFRVLRPHTLTHPVSQPASQAFSFSHSPGPDGFIVREWEWKKLSVPFCLIHCCCWCWMVCAANTPGTSSLVTESVPHQPHRHSLEWEHSVGREYNCLDLSGYSVRACVVLCLWCRA